MKYILKITTSDGRSKEHTLTAEQTTIGSATTSDISLPEETHLLASHILLAPSPDACWVSTAPQAPLHNKLGEAVSAAYVPWGQTLKLGRCTFELLARSTEIRETEKPINFTTIAAVLACIVILWGWQHFHVQRTAVQDIPVETPELFAEDSACQSPNPRHRAGLAVQEAVAKSERRVFDLQDGVAAVKLYSEARVCFQKAGLIEQSRQVEATENALRNELQENYKLLQVQLTRALKTRDNNSASRYIRQLSSLLRHRSDTTYALALRRLQLRLYNKRNSVQQSL